MRSFCRHLGIVAFAVFATGCSTCSSQDEQSSPPAASAHRGPPLAPGDVVVAEYARASFFEGTVAVVGPDDLTVLEHGTKRSREVDAANVYRLPPRGDPDWAAGSLGICQVAPHRWLGCRAQEADGDLVRVVDEQGNERTLPPLSLIKPSPVTQLNLRHVFAALDHAKQFAAEARRAGRPYRPSDWQPRKGEGVIVRDGGTYVSAVVHEPRKSLALVVSGGSSDNPRAIALDDVWPQPPVDAPLSPGGYACLRPNQGQQTWRIVRVVDIKKAEVVVSVSSGEKQVVKPRDLLPLIEHTPSTGH